jgi:hypothetical protein
VRVCMDKYSIMRWNGGTSDSKFTYEPSQAKAYDFNPDLHHRPF